MQEQIISFETAKLAKDKGFDIETDKGYYKHGSENDFVKLLLWVNIEEAKPEFGYAPTQSLLQKWLRDVHNIHISIDTMYLSKGKVWDCYIGEVSGESSIWNKEIKGSYEEALEVGLQEALKLIKL